MRRELLLPLRTSLLAALMGCGDEDKVDTQRDTEWPDSPAPEVTCEGSTEVLVDGNPTGYEQCPDGAINRVSAVAVDPTISATACQGTETFSYCSTDADCTDQAYGKCITGVEDWSGDTYCGCVYSCTVDSDCGAGQVCAPQGIKPLGWGVEWSLCVTAGCTTNSDCATGECGFDSYNDGCGEVPVLACRDDAQDSCRSDDDCGDDDCGALGAQGPFECVEENCAIGRPLMVEGQARTAESGGSGWCGEVPSLALDADEGARWLAVAEMEHASVASFARFTLQLMALGAPPALLAQAQQAAADEVEHARLAYGIASQLLGCEVGPGPLPLDGFSVETSPEAVMAALIEEACVGETLGVAEALHRADTATDPILKAVHARIAADEQRHARLAWDTLAWMVGRFGLDPRPHFERALAGLKDPVHLAAADEVIRPCLAAVA